MSAITLSVCAISGATRLQLQGDYRYHFTQDNPELVAFNKIEDTYTKVDNLLFVLAPKSGTVFERETLDAVLWLTDQAWQIPFSIRVDSLTNFQHTQADADDLIVGDLVTSPISISSSELQRISEIALAESSLVNKLVSNSGAATAINVTVRLPDKGGDEAKPALYGAELVDKLRTMYPNIDVGVTGSIALIYAMMETPQRDAMTLVPIMYLVLFISMFVFLRSIWAVLGLLFMVGLAAGTAMGLAGWLGIPLSPPMGSATTIILTVAVADGVHILVVFSKILRSGVSRTAAIEQSLVINWQPILLTTITTIIGFMSLNFAGIPPFSDLGNVTAIGVAAAWVLAVTLLPGFMAIAPFKVRENEPESRFALDKFAEWLIRHRSTILPSTIIFAIVCAVFIPRTELDDSFIEFFDENVTFRADTEFAIENISGIYQLHYSLGAAQEGGISDPAYLRSVDDFANWLREQPEIDHVGALPDTMKRLNMNMHGDDPGAYLLPVNRDLAAQYLLLYEMSLPYGLDLNNQIDIKKSATRVTAVVGNLSADELRALNDRAMQWLETNTPTTMHGSAASASFMLANLSRRSVDSMIKGTTIAFSLIALILVLSFQSLRYGLISLVPNIVPIVIAYGIWAILIGKVGMVFAIVTASSLGIIVDATVHFIAKYIRARKIDSASPEDAVRYAMSTVGDALLTTFLILAAGFAVLSFSTFKVNEDFGMLTAMTIIAAIIADFLLLPTLLMRLDRQD